MSKTNYAMVRAPGSADGDFAKRTAARLEQIQSQLKAKPRGSRLKDKVCIVTGVGSLAGIGCVCTLVVPVANRKPSLAGGLLRCSSPTKVRASCDASLYELLKSSLRHRRRASLPHRF